MSQPLDKYREYYYNTIVVPSYVLIPKFTAKIYSYAFFNIGVMDFLCDFGVNSPQT
jgi:hypothetical protein